MSFLEALKSRGFWAFVVVIVLLDILAAFMVKGFESFVYLLVLELIACVLYAISRMMIRADDPLEFFKK